jgi:drug/metabolite transporter (DMT)-like permease
MTVSMACFTVNDACVKLATASLPIGETIALRGVFATLLVLAAATAEGALAEAPQALKPMVVLRGGLDALTAFLFVWALMRLPIADATAVLMLSPLIGTALSVVLLREAVDRRRWAAVGLGFAGMLLVVRPGGDAFNGAGLVALLAAVAVACRDIATRRIRPVRPILVTLTTSAVGTLAASLLVAVEDWRMPSGTAWALLAGAAVAISAAHFLMVLAFRTAEVSAVAPFRYSIVLWALVAGLLVWGRVPDPIALAGIGLIIASGLMAFGRMRGRAPGRSGEAGRPRGP